MVGIGGPCSPISEWTEVEDFPQQDIQYLNELAAGGCPIEPEVVGDPGRAMTMASLSLLLLCVIAVGSSML